MHTHSSAMKFIEYLEKNNCSNVFLDLSTKCDLKCLFCSRSLCRNESKSPGLKLGDIVYAMRAIYPILKKKELFIGGTEPLNYKDISLLIKQAKRIGFSHISIATSGIKLSDKQFVKVLVESGVSSFELPLYGHNPALHDYIVQKKGSFKKLMEGIRNLRQHRGIGIFLHTILLKQNYLFFDEIDKFVNNRLKISPFRFYPVGPRNGILQDYASLCPSYTKIKKAIKKHSPKDEFFGFPLCVLPNSCLKISSKQKYVKHSQPIRISNQGVSLGVNSNNEDVRRQIKPLKCKRCKVSNFCTGVYPLYLDLYGDTELKPKK